MPVWALALPAPRCDRLVAPGQSLRDAIASAPTGGVVCLGAGTYLETPVFDATTPPGITLRGAGPQATILDGRDGRDGILIFNTSGIAVEDLGLHGGVPANAYVFSSTDVRFRNVEVSGGQIGVHVDAGSAAEVRDSVVQGVSADGILIRNGSSASVLGTAVRESGGVGVSAVGNVGRVQLTGNEVLSNRGPGFFAGQTPCALLPPASPEPPACFRADPAAFLASGELYLYRNTFKGNGSTGLVFFPGMTATLTSNEVSDNRLTGLFVWGADVAAVHNTFLRNEEHAAEYRAYPAPRFPGPLPGTVLQLATGSFQDNVVQATAPLGAILGGGLLSQGARLTVRDNTMVDNAGIGISFVNGAEGEITSNIIIRNKGSAICLFFAGSVDIGGNTAEGNLTDRVGVCAEQRH